MALDPSSGWTLGQLGTPTQSTMPLSPQQVQQIQHTTAAMQQPMSPPATQQQTAMMSGLFGPQGNMGQNLGSMTGAFRGRPGLWWREHLYGCIWRKCCGPASRFDRSRLRVIHGA